MQQWLLHLATVNCPYKGHQMPTSSYAIAHSNGATSMCDQSPFHVNVLDCRARTATEFRATTALL